MNDEQKYKGLLTVAIYARRKKISTTTVYEHIRNGKLKLVEISGVKFVKT